MPGAKIYRNNFPAIFDMVAAQKVICEAMKPSPITGVEIFAAGTFHKGSPEEVTFSESDLDDIVRNFAELSAGDRPKYEPYLKIGKYDPHEGEVVTFEDGNPSAGQPRNVRRKGKLLLADFADLSPTVGRWIELKLYRKVSAEIDKPPAGEMHPDLGVKGAVLKAVSLLGANPPAVKGLADIPMPKKFANKPNKFSHHCFSEVPAMDRQGMLDFLSTNGVDVAGITDVVPDAVLASMVAAMQTLMDQVTQQAGLAGTPSAAAATTAGTATAPAPGPMMPKSLTAKFAEMEAKIATLTATADATAGTIGKNHDTAKRTLVNNFCEQAIKDKVMTPGEVECGPDGEPLPQTVKARLLRADHTKQHVFSEGGKQVQKTELELQMDEIKRRTPHKFSERVVAGAKAGKFDAIRAKVKAEQDARGAASPGRTLHERLNLLPSLGAR